ncbi:MAG: UvrD-helicase domain-containing protein [Planctomycetota bacterium]|nr:UvrD-helicase domain-containing protein [Planctomycetota bacterium]
MLDLLSDLNEPQRQAVKHVAGPLLVLAGAGSGKTRVITRRVAYLIHQGVSPWNVLAITFTNKAAEEMRHRVELLNAPRGATVCTFHSLCARLLRQFATEANLTANYSIYDRADQIRCVKDAMACLDLRTANLEPAKVHATISNAKNDLLTAEAFAEQAGDFYTRNVAKIYRQYERRLAANNALDFDDLLLRTAFLLRDRPDIRRQLGEQYRYVLIDEYQDTNRAQYILAHGIAVDHENICATGDPDQSIYAWRGADIDNILRFESDYPGAVVCRLEENYRSTKAILSAASRLISRNRMRKDKALWTRRDGGCNVRVVCCDDAHAEADQIVRRVEALKKSGRNYDDVAVFYRVNSLSRMLEGAFMKAGVPYRIARGVEFYNRREIRDVLAYLRLLANPSDDVSCLRIINTPARGIGGTTVGRLNDFAAARGVPVFEACRHANETAMGSAAAGKVGAFCKLIEALAGELDRPVRDIVEDVVRRTGLEASYGRDDESSRQASANVGELISTAAEFDAEYEGESLADFLHQVSLVSDVDRLEGGSGAVTLMTLHAAKGLEFDVVFIVGCEDGLLPFARSETQSMGFQPSAELEEERRLAFVGMTRARDELTLFCVRCRMLRGQTASQAASRFLSEIDGESVDFEDATTECFSPETGRQRRRGGFYSERYAHRRREDAQAGAEERATDKAIAHSITVPVEYEYLTAGCMVRHPVFGVGRVRRLARHWPDTRADICFKDCGTKRIVLSKTTLEMLGENQP